MKKFIKKFLFLKTTPLHLIAISTILFAATVMMIGSPFLSIVAFYPLFVLISKPNLSFKQIVKYLIITGILMNLCAYPWVYSTMISLLQYNPIKSALVFIILSAINSSLLIGSLIFVSYFWKKYNNNLFLVFFPLLYFLLKITIGEMVPLDFVYGFLKENDAYSTFYISKIIGTHGLMTLILLINCLLFILIERKNTHLRVTSFIVGTIILLEISGVLVRGAGDLPIKKQANITVIQSNIHFRDFELKYGGNYKKVVLDEMKNYIEIASIKYPNTNMYLFSENSLPIDMKDLTSPEYQYFIDFLKFKNKPVLMGGYTVDDTGKVLNIIFEISGEGIKNIYAKKILMPFGEYIPFAQNKMIREFFNLRDIYNDVSKYEQHVFPSEKISYKPIICYESIFSSFIRENNKGADVLFVLANNYWSNSKIENVGYLYRSLASGVELGKPIIVSGQSGYSSMLDSDGEFLMEGSSRKISNLFKSEIIHFDVKVKEYQETFYAKYGYTPFITLLTLFSISFFLILRKRKL